MNQLMSLSIVIPVYNEESSIASFLNELFLALSRVEFSYEVIIVDDGSNDGTRDVLKRHAYSIQLVSHVVNRGYGAALKSGVRQSQYENILIIDADLTYVPKDMFSLISAMSGQDMIVGARIGKYVQIPLVRRPAKWVLNQLANYMAGIKIPDLNSGFRIIKKDLILKYIKVLPDGFSFTTTITIALLTNGYKVNYVPIQYHTRSGKSKIRPIRDTLNFFKLVIRTTLYFSPLKVFLPISGLFFLGFLISFSVDVYHMNMTEKTILLFVSACMILSISCLADLLDKRLP